MNYERKPKKRKILPTQWNNSIWTFLPRFGGIQKYAKIDRKSFEFEYNDETKVYYQININDTFLPIKNNTLTNNAKITTQKWIKTTKTEDQLTALNKQFQTSSYLDGSSLKKLVTETKLTKTQIQDWFSRKRRANNDNKENIRSAKVIRIWSA